MGWLPIWIGGALGGMLDPLRLLILLPVALLSRAWWPLLAVAFALSGLHLWLTERDGLPIEDLDRVQAFAGSAGALALASLLWWIVRRSRAAKAPEA